MLQETCQDVYRRPHRQSFPRPLTHTSLLADAFYSPKRKDDQVHQCPGARREGILLPQRTVDRECPPSGNRSKPQTPVLG